MVFDLIEKIMARFKLAYAEARKVSQQKEKKKDADNISEKETSKPEEDNMKNEEAKPEHENLAYPGQ